MTSVSIKDLSRTLPSNSHRLQPSFATHLLSPSPSGGLFLSSGYTMTSFRLKCTISSRLSLVTLTSPGKKMEP